MGEAREHGRAVTATTEEEVREGREVDDAAASAVLVRMTKPSKYAWW